MDSVRFAMPRGPIRPKRAQKEVLRQQVTLEPFIFLSRLVTSGTFCPKWGVPKIGDFEGSGAEFEDSGGMGV